MIDKYPTIDPSENSSSCDLSATDLGRVALTPEKIAQTTTPPEAPTADVQKPKVSEMLEIYDMTKGQPEHQHIGRI